MKIKDIIKRLAKYDKNLEILITTGDREFFYPLLKIKKESRKRLLEIDGDKDMDGCLKAQGISKEFVSIEF